MIAERSGQREVWGEGTDQNWFLSLADAKPKRKAFRHEYNCENPQSSIGHKTPAESVGLIGTPSQPRGP
jgi:putative transposase